MCNIRVLPRVVLAIEGQWYDYSEQVFSPSQMEDDGWLPYYFNYVLCIVCDIKKYWFI